VHRWCIFSRGEHIVACIRGVRALSLSFFLSINVAGSYSYAKSDTCLFPWMVPRRGSSSSSTGRAISGVAPFHLSPCLFLSLSISLPSHGGTHKPFAKAYAHTYGGEGWTDVLVEGMTHRHEYLSRPLNSGPLLRGVCLVSTTKPSESTNCSRSCAGIHVGSETFLEA